MPGHGLKSLLMAGMTVATLVVVLRVGWIYMKRAEDSAPAGRVETIVGIPKELDTKDLRILSFYTADRPVRGEPFVVCYSVLNAVSVALDPPLAEVAPSLNRCVEVVLKHESELTLTAIGKDGERAAASFVIGVSEPRPEFKFVEISSREIKRGEKFTLCYGVKNATKLRLEPEGRVLPAVEKTCFMWYPQLKPLRLIAESPGGREEVPLPVRMIN